MLFGVVFGAYFHQDKKTAEIQKDDKSNSVISASIGGVAYFFDTLGIGSFATSTALLRFFKQVPARLIPGTLNVSCAIPSLLEAFIFISIIQVDYITLLGMVGGACVGSWFGAGFVSKLPEQKIRIIISVALLITATFMLTKQLHLIPSNEVAAALGFRGTKLIIATLGSVLIGVLTCMGIGNYAPNLALGLLLGMSARTIFPIMASGAAFSSTLAGIKFIKTGKYARKVCLAMIGLGVVGVLLAAYLVKTLPLHILNWVVIAVIYYTAMTLLLEAHKERQKQA